MKLAAFNASLAAIAMTKREQPSNERELAPLRKGLRLAMRKCLNLSARRLVDGHAR